MRKRFLSAAIVVLIALGVCPYTDGFAKPSNVSESLRADNKRVSLVVEPGAIVKELSISFSEAVDGATVDVTDVSGKKVLTVEIESGRTRAKLNVSELKTGSYFVIFNNGDSRASKIFLKV